MILKALSTTLCPWNVVKTKMHTFNKHWYLLFLCKCWLRDWSCRRSKKLNSSKLGRFLRAIDLRKSSYWILTPSFCFAVRCSSWNNLLTRYSNFATNISDYFAKLTGDKQEASLTTTDFTGLHSCSFNIMFISMAAESPWIFFSSLKQLLLRRKLLVAVGNFMAALSKIFCSLVFCFN